MGAKEIRDALIQVEQEGIKCLTCELPAQEKKKHCVHCEAYWDDVDNGVFEDDDWQEYDDTEPEPDDYDYDDYDPYEWGGWLDNE